MEGVDKVEINMFIRDGWRGRELVGVFVAIAIALTLVHFVPQSVHFLMVFVLWVAVTIVHLHHLVAVICWLAVFLAAVAVALAVLVALVWMVIQPEASNGAIMAIDVAMGVLLCHRHCLESFLLLSDSIVDLFLLLGPLGAFNLVNRPASALGRDDGGVNPEPQQSSPRSLVVVGPSRAILAVLHGLP